MLKNESGFTLIEMLIVLAVISLLLILFIPNLADKNNSIQDKGCEALIALAENQLLAYHLDEKDSITTAKDLVDAGYLKSTECANGSKKIVYQKDSDIHFTLEETN
ncbi:competence protein ComGC [Gracilibacillus ureilyticus]|uniref:ComG operon protein 3 n=1 Tax=Gracilibacillus ureilyticus TaxID=531814 RepID=A0A1H9LYW8_9BACI|nr:competence type IV pilus major pilin ComGC [Gracilibacillus ureilyticus]SER16616.1 competence protein ComGC [Gracilibacillus ureilyticus]